MITTKGHSIAAVCEWANKAVNNKNGDTAEIQTAFRETLKKGIKRAGYPSCEAELGIIDEISDFDVTPMAEQLPNVIILSMQRNHMSLIRVIMRFVSTIPFVNLI